MTSRAVVFMANDRYRDWALTFLESVREQNATLPIHCIPYDANAGKIASLRTAFGFEMIDADFAALDAFADRLFPTHPMKRANLRKYAALQLDCDEVAYFDVDTVMLLDPARLFGFVKPGALDLVYLSTSPGYVYRRDRMALARAHFPCMRQVSAGGFVTSRHAFSIEEIIETIESNRDLYFAVRPRSRLYDQPVLNFVLDCAAKKCRHISECDDTLAGIASSRSRQIGFQDGRLVERSSNREVVAVHWAGALKRVVEILDIRARRLSRMRADYLKRGRQRLAGAMAQ